MSLWSARDYGCWNILILPPNFFYKMGGFSAPNVAFLDENFLTGRKFSDNFLTAPSAPLARWQDITGSVCEWTVYKLVECVDTESSACRRYAVAARSSVAVIQTSSSQSKLRVDMMTWSPADCHCVQHSCVKRTCLTAQIRLLFKNWLTGCRVNVLSIFCVVSLLGRP